MMPSGISLFSLSRDELNSERGGVCGVINPVQMKKLLLPVVVVGVAVVVQLGGGGSRGCLTALPLGQRDANIIGGCRGARETRRVTRRKQRKGEQGDLDLEC